MMITAQSLVFCHLTGHEKRQCFGNKTISHHHNYFPFRSFSSYGWMARRNDTLKGGGTPTCVDEGCCSISRYGWDWSSAYIFILCFTSSKKTHREIRPDKRGLVRLLCPKFVFQKLRLKTACFFYFEKWEKSTQKISVCFLIPDTSVQNVRTMLRLRAVRKKYRLQVFLVRSSFPAHVVIPLPYDSRFCCFGTLLPALYSSMSLKDENRWYHINTAGELA